MQTAPDAECQETLAHGEALHLQIERARDASWGAYRSVRRLVFDRQPGPIDESQLDARQRRALMLWHRAERTLDCLRRTWHRHGHDDGRQPA